MKIYTRGGDKGKTGVFGGKREFKDSARIECNGEIDEANSSIGMLRVTLGEDHEWQTNLHRIQKDLMDMMSHLATPSNARKENKNDKPIDGPKFCEDWVDALEASISSPSDYFILPGGNKVSAWCHVCRTQIRRAERRLVTLMHEDPESIDDYIPAYINRLSDLFFTMARVAMDKEGVVEEKWKPFLYKKFR